MAFAKIKLSLKSALFASAVATMGVSFAATSVGVNVAYAQDASRQFSAATGEIVNNALQFLNSDQYQAALSELSKAVAIPDTNAYERSIIYQMQGQAYYELKQTGSAIQSFENAISAGGLLPNESSQLLSLIHI